MKELSLFSGAGGGLLGTKLLDWECVGYVEINEYCQKVLRARIDDGYLDEAPIFTDVFEFIESGAARQYRGFVDVVTAGFVCTENSIANQNAKGMDEGVSLETWGATAECIRLIRPPFVQLENSPAILVRGFERVANDLAEMGYSFSWCVLGADAIGARHHRARWWLVAHANSDGLQGSAETTDSKSTSKREQSWRKTSRTFVEEISGRNRNKTEPSLQRRLDDVADRVDRLTAIGNGQVPVVAKTAWQILSESLV